MKRTATEIIKEMENTGIMMSNEHTFNEYVQEACAFQKMICEMIAGSAYHETMRADEALFIMESTARKLKLRSNPAVHNGVMALKKLDKEMGILMSGAKGEQLVSRTLEFLDRPNTQIFRNVYISDGNDETELDGVVVTDNGIIILEVKKVKQDLTLTEDGRMVFSGDECYDKMPLCKKMALKRKLLKTRLESIIAAKGLNIPVYVDSFIVFSTPKGQYIRIDDRYHQEKYCFRTGLNKKIENYVGCAYYKADQLVQLGELIGAMATNIKRFETKLNYDDIRSSIAEALAILENAQADTRSKFVKFISPRYVSRNTSEKRNGFGYSIASAIANALMVGATTLLILAKEGA